MALQYPGISYLKGYDGKVSDILDAWNTGEAAGKSQRFEDQAPDEFAKTLPPLSEYGLTTSPDDLKAMFANPNTRALALSQVQEATQRRADSMDPLKQAQIKKAQYEAAHVGDAPRNATMDNANTRMKLGWEQGLRGDALRNYVLTGDLAKPDAAPNAPSGYSYQQDGSLAFIPGGPADPAAASVKPPTDSQRRAGQLTEVVKPDASLLLGDGSEANPGVFDSLSNGWDQIGGAQVPFVGGAPMKSFTASDYQRANNAITNIAQSYLYAVSGQAAPAEEVNKIVQSVTPQFGEDKKAVQDKKDRLKTYVDAIALGQQQGGANAAAANDQQGETRIVNGKTYVRDANGDWYEQ